MAYFSNGTMGDLFRDRNCYRCVNWKDEGDGRGPGCPIMDAHLIFDYYVRGAKDDDGKPVRSEAADVLDLLIPRSEFTEDHAWVIPTCSMFHLDTSDTALERRGQLNAFTPTDQPHA